MSNKSSNRSFIDSTPSWAFALLFFGVALLSFLLFNFDRELIRLECRFVVFVRELSAGAHPGLFPSLYGEHYADYPSTYSLLSFGLSKLFGSVCAFTLVLPVAVSIAASIAVTFLIGAEQSKKLGIIAALLLFCTYGFINGGRSIAMDAFVCLGATCAFRFAQLSSLRSGIWSAVHFTLGLCAIAFAFSFRGPIGAVVASAAFISWSLGALEWRKAFFAALACGILFAMLTTGLFAMAWLEGGHKLLSGVLDSQIGGRLSGSGKPFYLYFTNGLAEFAVAFPLALAALFFARGGIWRKGRGADLELFGRFILWGLIVVLGMTVPSTRHLRYILPAIPAFALAAACLWTSPESFKIPESFAKTLRWLNVGRVAIAAAIMTVFCISVVDYLETKSQEARTFVREVEEKLPSPNAYAFFELGPDGDELKFLCNAKVFFHPVFVSTPSEIENSKVPVIALAKAFNALPEALKARAKGLIKGEMGHKSCVAFVIEAEKSASANMKSP